MRCAITDKLLLPLKFCCHAWLHEKSPLVWAGWGVKKPAQAVRLAGVKPGAVPGREVCGGRWEDSNPH